MLRLLPGSHLYPSPPQRHCRRNTTSSRVNYVQPHAGAVRSLTFLYQRPITVTLVKIGLEFQLITLQEIYHAGIMCRDIMNGCKNLLDK